MRFFFLFSLLTFVGVSLAQEENKPYSIIRLGYFPSNNIPKDFTDKVMTMKNVKIHSSEQNGYTSFYTDKIYDQDEVSKTEDLLKKHGFTKTSVEKMDFLIAGPDPEKIEKKKWKTGEDVPYKENEKADCDQFLVCIGKYAYMAPQYVLDAVKDYKKHELMARGSGTMMVLTKFAYEYDQALQIKNELIADGFLGSKIICNDGQKLMASEEQGTKKDEIQLNYPEIGSNKDGPWKKLYESGRIFQKGTIKNGKLNGAFEAYHENGKLMAKGKYKNGKKKGLWIWYHPNGKIFKEGKFNEDLQDGEWNYYNENGQLESTLTFENGETVTK